jgi:DNA-binding XRE family transcriptional regulator
LGSQQNPKADPLKQQNNLSFLRQKENLSQKEFADILDVSPRSVLNYENGDTVLSFASLERLLDHFDLKASDFFNTDLKLKAAPVAAVESAPSANVPVTTPTPTPTVPVEAMPSAPISAPRRFSWAKRISIGAGTFVLLGILLGATSPLWAHKSSEIKVDSPASSTSGSSSLNASSSLNGPSSSSDSSSSANSSSSSNASSSSSSSSSSSVSSSSSSSSNNSSSSSSSNSSSSASSSSSEPDLSPLVPGLKKFQIITPVGEVSSYLGRTGSHLLTMDTGDWSFPSNATDLYDLSFSLSAANGNSIRGISFSYNPPSAAVSDFGKRYIQIDQGAVDGSVFSVIPVLRVKGSSSLTGTTLEVKVYNPAGQDIIKELAGLKSFSASFDEKDNLTPLEVGLHNFSYTTSPATYFQDVGASVHLRKASDEYGLNLSGNVLTVSDYSSLEEAMHSLVLDVTLDDSDASISIPFFVHRPQTNVLNWAFPKLTGFYLRYGELQGIRAGEGTHLLNPLYEGASYDDGKYSLSFEGLDTLPSGMKLASASVNGPITLIVPTGLTSGSRYRITATLYETNDKSVAVTSRPFLIEIV